MTELHRSGARAASVKRRRRKATAALSIAAVAGLGLAPATQAASSGGTAFGAPIKESSSKQSSRSARATAVRVPVVLKRIARCESGGDPTAVSDNGQYRGKYQFSFETWQSVGGSGDPADASESEQDRRALRLYRSEGTTPWPECGAAATGGN